MRKIIGLFSVVLVASVASAQSFGFETSEGFTAGALAGQNGWTASSHYSIVDNFARTGTQSVLASGNSGAHFAWVDLIASPGYTTGTFSASTWMHIGANTVADRVQGLNAWGNTNGWSIGLKSNGEVIGGFGSLWNRPVLGTVANPTQRWINLTLTFNVGAGTAIATVDGQTFNLTGTGLTSFTDMDFVTDWISASASSGFVHFDDLTVVPEPATMTVLALGALAALRRRKA